MQSPTSPPPVRQIGVDQHSLHAAGHDRGLGRYASAVAEAISTRSDLDPIDIVFNKGTGPIAIGRTIDAALPDGLPYHALNARHLPIRKNRPWVCSVLDTIPLDIAEYRRLGVRTRLSFLNSIRSDLILTISHFAADRIREHGGRSCPDIRVCPLPVGDAFRARARPLHESFAGEIADRLKCAPYIIGLVDWRTPDPRKRFPWIYQLEGVIARHGIETVIAGRGTSLGPPRRGVAIENPTNEQLASLYSGAAAFFYPSAYEGQGLPPLEAIASGCPVVAFDNSAVSEMVQVDQYLLPDPMPWRNGDLASLMPTDTVGAVIERVRSWIDNPTLKGELVEASRRALLQYALPDFAVGLASAYRSMWEK